MKVVIFAGGQGTRFQEETHKVPKPMIEIGGRPIIWHIMKNYAYFGFTDFIILAGYKQEYIKDYFYNYHLHNSNVKISLTGDKEIQFYDEISEDWNVTVLDTGLYATTGERLLKAKDFIWNDTFLLTYGDGVSDINIETLIDFHSKNDSIVTMTSVQPMGKYGNVIIDDYNSVIKYEEKPESEDTWINGGFFVADKSIFDCLEENDFSNTLKLLSVNDSLSAYRYKGFWKSMDTLSDKLILEDLWKTKKYPWKLWK